MHYSCQCITMQCQLKLSTAALSSLLVNALPACLSIQCNTTKYSSSKYALHHMQYNANALQFIAINTMPSFVIQYSIIQSYFCDDYHPDNRETGYTNVLYGVSPCYGVSLWMAIACDSSCYGGACVMVLNYAFPTEVKCAKRAPRRTVAAKSCNVFSKSQCDSQCVTRIQDCGWQRMSGVPFLCI